MTLLASTAGDAAYWGLAIFLVAIGLAAAFMLFRLGQAFERLSSFIKGTERDLLPVIVKAGATVDRVNYQLDKADTVTDSAVSMADSADTAVRAISTVDRDARGEDLGSRSGGHARLSPSSASRRTSATRRRRPGRRPADAKPTCATTCDMRAGRRWRPTARQPQPRPEASRSPTRGRAGAGAEAAPAPIPPDEPTAA